MEPQIPDYLSIIFMTLTFALLFLVVLGYRSVLQKSGMEEGLRKKRVRSLAIPLIFWLLFLARISTMNFFHDWSAIPPRLIIAVLPPLVFAIALVSSKKMTELLKHVPAHWLIWIQSFRIVMEVILLMLFLENVIPVQMTFEGRNFDILSGIVALFAGYVVYKNKASRNFILGWNIFGLLLLANIVIVAVLSAPLPFRVFMNDPANTVVVYFPFVWLPGFVVPVAYTMHFLSIKKCVAERK